MLVSRVTYIHKSPNNEHNHACTMLRRCELFIHCAVDPDCINFYCERLWQTPDYRFYFRLTWTIPDYLRYGNIIDSFKIDPRVRDGQGNVILNQGTPQVTVDYNHVCEVMTITVFRL